MDNNLTENIVAESGQEIKTEKSVDYYKKILKSKRFSLICIRIFDLVTSFLGLVFLFLPFILVSLIIVLDSRGGAFFKQKRVGRNGKIFNIIKFRTMVKDAEKKGLQISTGDDCRITAVGKFLRKTKFDELPQLFNVFAGQMSFVGPRPEVPKYVAMYDELQSNVLLVRPGITDKASIEFRNENDILQNADDPERVYINEIMPKKLGYNLEYIEKISLCYNIRLIFKTILAII